MEARTRISVTLGARDLDVLRWLAGEDGRVPAAIASGLLADGIERIMQAAQQPMAA